MHREDLEKDTTSPDLLSEIEKWENVFALLDEAGEAKNKRVLEILGAGYGVTVELPIKECKVSCHGI